LALLAGASRRLPLSARLVAMPLRGPFKDDGRQKCKQLSLGLQRAVAGSHEDFGDGRVASFDLAQVLRRETHLSAEALQREGAGQAARANLGAKPGGVGAVRVQWCQWATHPRAKA
jgi:hypothetical protein